MGIPAAIPAAAPGPAVVGPAALASERGGQYTREAVVSAAAVAVSAAGAVSASAASAAMAARRLSPPTSSGGGGGGASTSGIALPKPTPRRLSRTSASMASAPRKDTRKGQGFETPEATVTSTSLTSGIDCRIFQRTASTTWLAAEAGTSGLIWIRMSTRVLEPILRARTLRSSTPNTPSTSRARAADRTTAFSSTPSVSC
mmetsp:Transcript_17807/g.40805  ORF Transcript_17807/g.40805 Transcript_17807/m.40805 type:complete len:201 (-) Transcript_17807:1268-1870(-)